MSREGRPWPLKLKNGVAGPINETRLIPWYAVIALFLCLHFPGCESRKFESEGMNAGKTIAFDLSRLNDEGLQGPPDGLRALHYEFCIPANDAFVREISRIDTTVQIFTEAKGKIRCASDQYLCLGHTHQKDFAGVLIRLASLPYVHRIEESTFEQ